MNAAALEQLATATLNGSMPFPEILGRLMDEGVDFYQVDYRLRQFRFYGAHGDAMLAGVQFYSVFLSGKRVMYLGRQCDQHVEWFPGAAPVA